MGSRSIGCPLLPSMLPITMASWHGGPSGTKSSAIGRNKVTPAHRGWRKGKGLFTPCFPLDEGMFAALQGCQL